MQERTKQLVEVGWAATLQITLMCARSSLVVLLCSPFCLRPFVFQNESCACFRNVPLLVSLDCGHCLRDVLPTDLFFSRRPSWNVCASSHSGADFPSLYCASTFWEWMVAEKIFEQICFFIHNELIHEWYKSGTKIWGTTNSFWDAVSLIHNEFAVRAFRYIFLSSKCFLKKHLQTLRNNSPKVQWTEVLKVGTCRY
jgi:hypothetical protein